ncbi:MAG: hypothetical protein NTX50_30580 [Candidatus Sumerlaeota bacterium]|nr:hypothetical protein [Candidatus Sumerlaeota bacterium]
MPVEMRRGSDPALIPGDIKDKDRTSASDADNIGMRKFLPHFVNVFPSSGTQSGHKPFHPRFDMRMPIRKALKTFFRYDPHSGAF